jgi:hypothetical protein
MPTICSSFAHLQCIASSPEIVTTLIMLPFL